MSSTAHQATSKRSTVVRYKCTTEKGGQRIKLLTVIESTCLAPCRMRGPGSQTRLLLADKDPLVLPDCLLHVLKSFSQERQLPPLLQTTFALFMPSCLCSRLRSDAVWAPISYHIPKSSSTCKQGEHGSLIGRHLVHQRARVVAAVILCMGTISIAGCGTRPSNQSKRLASISKAFPSAASITLRQFALPF